MVSIPSETSFLALMHEITKRMAELAGFDQATSARLASAVDEATTNVIEHAYGGGGPDRPLDVAIEDRGKTFWVEIADRGTKVDPRSVPQVDLQRYVSEHRTGGLGVHLMGKIMDSVTFKRAAGQNVCRMVKKKEPPARG